MEINYSLLATLVVFIIIFDSAATGLQVTKAELSLKNLVILNQDNTSNQATGGSDLNLDTKKLDQSKKDIDQAGGSKESDPISDLKKSNLNKELQLKEGQNVKRDANSNGSVKDGEKKQVDKPSETNEVPKDAKETLLPKRKDGFRGEECDLLNRCTDEKNALVACLRVPGNDSPDLSLLVQNKGKGTLTVTISAPDYVQLEKTQIPLQEKENKKVKVSIGNGVGDSLIVLEAGYGKCNLDFRDLIAPNLKKEPDFDSPTYINLLKLIPSAKVLIFAVIIKTALVWMCISFYRRQGTKGSKYRKVGVELPVSHGGKKVSDLNDGWQNSWGDNWDEEEAPKKNGWGDNWDDEEAPKTPSMPVTPGLSSSKSMASRRINKDGWKD